MTIKMVIAIILGFLFMEVMGIAKTRKKFKAEKKVFDVKVYLKDDMYSLILGLILLIFYALDFEEAVSLLPKEVPDSELMQGFLLGAGGLELVKKFLNLVIK